MAGRIHPNGEGSYKPLEDRGGKDSMVVKSALSISKAERSSCLTWRNVYARVKAPKKPTGAAVSPSSSANDEPTVRGKGGELKTVVQDVFGFCRAGESVAIIGPSGAGKSSFLDTISYRKTTGEFGGDIRLDGTPVDAKYMRFNAGYVTCDDIQIASLTVKETLLFAAQMRLGTILSSAEQRERVENVMLLMHLTKIANDLVGDNITRGISTGERKRLNIAIELLPESNILYLDEPTTGLDSLISKEIITQVGNITATLGLITMATIHQASYQILERFDFLMILVGGRLTYFGKTKHAIDYFSEILKSPVVNNPADHYIEVMARNPKQCQETWLGSSQCSQMREETDKYAVVRSGVAIPRQNHNLLGIGKQFQALITRTAKVFVRTPALSWARILIGALSSIFLGILFLNQDLTSHGFEGKALVVFAAGMAPHLLSTPTISVFIPGRVLFYQQVQAGFYYPLVYWAVFLFFELLINVTVIIIYGAIVFPLANFQSARIGGYIGILVANSVASTAINSAVATMNSSIPGAISISAFLFLYNLIFGAYLVLDSMMDINCLPCKYFFKWLSIQRHTVQSISVPEFKSLPFNCTKADKIPYDLSPIMATNMDRVVNFTVASIIKRYTNISQFDFPTIINYAAMAFASNLALQNRIAYSAYTTVSPYYQPVLTGLNSTFTTLLNSALMAPIKNISNFNATELAEFNRLKTLTLGSLAATQLKAAILSGAVALPDKSLCLYASGEAFLNGNLGMASDINTDLMAGLTVAVAVVFFVIGTVGIIKCKFHQR